jgi:hypothetical protein
MIKTLETQVGQFLLGCKCRVSRFLLGRAKDLSAPLYIGCVCLYLEKLSNAVINHAILRERVASGSELTNIQYHSLVLTTSFKYFNTTSLVV